LTKSNEIRIADALQPKLVQDLQSMIRQPSISATGEGLHECAALVRNIMNDSGIDSQLLCLDDAPPLVFGHVKSKNNPHKTLTFYNHYDVQPAEPLELWKYPPFEGRIVSGKIFGRGAADDKGELATRITAVRAHLEAYGDLPCNVKFIVEGEEETGSANIVRYLKKYRKRFACDGVVWEFGYVDAAKRAIVNLGMKGLLYVELSSAEARIDVHSSLAAVIENPAWRLVRALSSMRDDSGRILIKDWYKDVRPATETDISILKQEAFDESAFKKEYGISKFVNNKKGLDARKALALEPTCNIAGINSGYSGSGSKTVLPSRAVAKIDFRLVPDMDPKKQAAKLRKHLHINGFGDIKVRVLGSVAAFRTEPNHEFVGQIVSAAKKSYAGVVLGISSAGTGPMHAFANILGVPCVSVGSTYVFSKIHSPNEFARLDLLRMATRCMCRIITNFGRGGR